MRILAIDTSHPVGSVSMAIAGRPAGSVRFGSTQSHLVELMAAADRLARDAGIGLSGIDRLALVIGPGSFTGLRIGMSCVKGLYAALGTAVVTATSLELLARQTSAAGEVICAMIDARRDEVYAAAWNLRNGEIGEPIAGPQAAAPGELLDSLEGRETTFVGSGALRYRKLVEQAFSGSSHFVSADENLPSTAFLAGIAADLKPLSKDEVMRLEPFYIRPSDAKLKRIEER